MMSNNRRLVLSLSIAAAFAANNLFAEKTNPPFRPPAVETYASKQTQQGLSMAAVAYDDAEESKIAFGKLFPYEYGVLPVLVVMRNDSDKTLKLDRIRFQYMPTSGGKIDETPAGDVAYLHGAARAKVKNSPLPAGAPRVSVGKNPLKNTVIVERAFAAKMLPPGETAYGFVYFQTGHSRGASLYVTGIREAKTDQDLFYFEISLGK